MKKSPEVIYWNSRTRRNQKRKGVQYNPSKPYKRKVLGFEYIRAPEVIDLYSAKNYHRTLSFLDTVEQRSSFSPIMLVFSETERISAAALLLIFSRIELIIKQSAQICIRVQSATLNGVVKKAIHMSGLIDMTLNREPRPNRASSTLPIIKGTAEGEEFESVVDHIIDNIFENCTPEMERKVGSAVSETVSNVKLHAYPSSAGSDSNNKAWWLMCSEIDGSLYLAIYDSGVGIPKTIHKTGWINDFITNSAPHLLKAWTSQRDVDKIDISMEAGRTQTKEKKHGKGSKSIRALVEETPDGKLWVFSNNGLYKIDENSAIHLVEHDSSIQGTLVQWNIKIRD